MKCFSILKEFPDFEDLDTPESPLTAPHWSFLSQNSPDVEMLLQWVSSIPLNVLLLAQLSATVVMFLQAFLLLFWLTGRLAYMVYTCCVSPSQNPDTESLKASE